MHVHCVLKCTRLTNHIQANSQQMHARGQSLASQIFISCTVWLSVHVFGMCTRTRNVNYVLGNPLALPLLDPRP